MGLGRQTIANDTAQPRCRAIGRLHEQRIAAFRFTLAPHGTAYQKVVWQALLEIPFGATRTSRAMAARIGGSPRSVGQTNGRNPIPIIIPCHRVVVESHIGGYSGGDGLSNKHWLLALENPQRSLFAARVTNGETK